MVKKTYISPAALTVQLGTVQMMAQSLRIDRTGGASISSSDQILTKENKDVNVWDEEW